MYRGWLGQHTLHAQVLERHLWIHCVRTRRRHVLVKRRATRQARDATTVQVLKRDSLISIAITGMQAVVATSTAIATARAVVDMSRSPIATRTGRTSFVLRSARR